MLERAALQESESAAELVELRQVYASYVVESAGALREDAGGDLYVRLLFDQLKLSWRACSR